MTSGYGIVHNPLRSFVSAGSGGLRLLQSIVRNSLICCFERIGFLYSLIPLREVQLSLAEGSLRESQYVRNSLSVPNAYRLSRRSSSSVLSERSNFAYCDGPRCSML
jgi:hypothetical protein